MLTVPKKCTCGCRQLVLDHDELQCDDCFLIVASGVIIIDGKIVATKDFVDWTLE